VKKLIVIAASAFALAGCTPPETNNKPGNVSVVPEKKSLAMSDAETIDKEKAAWDAVRKKDFDNFKKMMATDGIYVSHHGVLDPDGTINETKELDLTDLTFSDWKVLPIDKDAVVVTYTAHIQGRIKGQSLVATSIRGSTAWVNRDGKWLAIYHQDSEAKPPTSSTKKEERTAPTPGKTLTQASTSGDPIANEKIVWDALKSDNSNAFAALLTPDSIEVEPESVYDKTGSVTTVSQTDFSKATLSEFKSVKIDEDAAIVTYLVKIPGVAPEGEHHTTIWVNRGGSWLALFHQGTPVLKMLQPVSPKESNKPPAKAPPVKY